MNRQISNPALRWLEVILAERFGHTWHLSHTTKGLSLSLDGAEGTIIFDTLQPGFTEAHSNQPSTSWDAQCEGWNSVLGRPLPAPGIANMQSPMIEPFSDGYFIHYDILGLTYWMLARVEEIDRIDLDSHQRFPATASHAFKHGYLDRPVVDEWMHVLRQVTQYQWQGIKLKRHEFQMRVSHDVDRPSLYAFKPWPQILRMMVGNLIKRKDFKAFIETPYIKLISKKRLLPNDPYNTFDWLMKVSESINLKSTFFFKGGKSDKIYDADYEIDHPVIRKLIREIYERGHEIGLHPSYNSYQNKKTIVKEFEKLKRVCENVGVIQETWGARMHYLRWKQPDTMSALVEAGIGYDATLGYADCPGFRCGTCYEYPAFDVQNQREIPLRIRPLILMEGSVLSTSYLGFSTGYDALNYMEKLKINCQLVLGQFSLLWHNSELTNEESKKLYRKLLID